LRHSAVALSSAFTFAQEKKKKSTISPKRKGKRKPNSPESNQYKPTKPDLTSQEWNIPLLIISCFALLLYFFLANLMIYNPM